MNSAHEVSYQDAIHQGLAEEMARDDAVYLMTAMDDYADHRLSHVARGLQASGGMGRVVPTHLAPTPLIHLAIGAALLGMRPIVELEHSGQLADAMGALTEMAASLHWRSGGELALPLVIRAPLLDGTHGGPMRTLHPEAWLASTPGLHVVLPTTPYDAKGLLKAAIRDQNPVIFLEPKYLYERLREELPSDDYVVPIGQAEVRRSGEHLTIITYGAMVYTVLDAADRLESEGISAEVIDLRSLAPLDLPLIRESLEHTTKVLIVHDATKSGGLGTSIAALLAEDCFDLLGGPILRIGALDVPTPLSPALATVYQPNIEAIIAAARKLVSP